METELLGEISTLRAANELIGAVSYEWVINILAQVWLVKSCHDGCSYFPREYNPIAKNSNGVLVWSFTNAICEW